MVDNDSKEYIDKLEKHIQSSKTNALYSIDRIDILIISLSSGGLVLSMGFVKDLIPNTTCTDYTLLILSWIFFAASIVGNFISQITAYHANEIEAKISKDLIRKEKGNKPKGNLKRQECFHSTFETLTNVLNKLSGILLVTAVILLVIFASINIKP